MKDTSQKPKNSCWPSGDRRGMKRGRSKTTGKKKKEKKTVGQKDNPKTLGGRTRGKTKIDLPGV